MKQTNNWEEVDKRFSKYWGAMFECGDYEELIKDIHQELTNLLKTVAEAMVEEDGLPSGFEEEEPYALAGFNTCRSQIISNISEKYPEFKELVKGK